MKPTPEQIAKLPKWAQDHFTDLERERATAIRALDEYIDAQTLSPFCTEDFESTGDKQGPTARTRYIQAHAIVVKWRGVILRVAANEFGNTGSGIRLQWEGMPRHSGGDVAFIPCSYQAARIVCKEDMR